MSVEALEIWNKAAKKAKKLHEISYRAWRRYYEAGQAERLAWDNYRKIGQEESK